MEQHRQQAQPRPSERGATAVEFALVFPLLFGVFWAIISYALPFFMYQTMNHAVAEVTRQAVRYENPDAATIKSLATTELHKFLPAAFANSLTVADPTITQESMQVLKADGSPELDGSGNPISLTYNVLTLKITYPGCNATTLKSFCVVPAFNLFGASIPSLGPYAVETKIHLSRP